VSGRRLALHALPVVAALFLTAPAPRPVHPAAASSFDHAAFDSLLRRHVVDGSVSYRKWKAALADRAALSAYVSRLATADTTGWSRAEQMAFWINAYNAITLDRVLSAYPVSSITKIKPTLGVLPGNGVWKEKHRVAGAPMSLDDIEHVVLRRHFADPRIHFAISCASKSCPPLAARAWSGGTLDADLDAATRRFVRSGRYNTIAAGKPWALSKIFEWYADDFVAAAGSVPAWVVRYLPPETARGVDPARVRWSARDYDWSLNER
jgi:hypothetical protein